MRQEIGLELSDLRLLLPAFRYRAVMDDETVENEICPVYSALADSAVRPDPGEVASCDWVDWAGFRDQVLGGHPRGQPVVRRAGASAPRGPVERPRRSRLGAAVGRRGMTVACGPGGPAW